MSEQRTAPVSEPKATMDSETAGGGQHEAILRSGTTVQLGFILPRLYLYLGVAGLIAAGALSAFVWHHFQVKGFEKAVESRLTAAHNSALSRALLLQKEQSDANASLLKNHITLLAKSRNSSLLAAQATAKSVAANSTSLDLLLDSIAKSDASCLAANNLPSTPAPRSNPPLPAATPGQLFPECAKSLRQMAEYSDALADQVRALQAYTQSLTPFFEPAP